MEPIAGARWPVVDREWGLALDGEFLVVLERRALPSWSEIRRMALPKLIAEIEDWIRTVVVPALQSMLDAIFPPSATPAAPDATVASTVTERLGRGAVQFNYTTKRFSYVPQDPGNV